jgi:hypothetical protein
MNLRKRFNYIYCRILYQMINDFGVEMV